MNKVIFGILVILVSLIDIFLGILTIFKKDRKLSCLFFVTSEVAVFYYLSILFTSYFLTALFSALYFCSISRLVLTLHFYIISYTEMKKNKPVKIIGYVLAVLCLIDMFIQLLNPFLELSIHFVYHPESIAMWTYEPKFLYKMHLIYCYVVLAYVFLTLNHKSFNTPRVYRVKYLGIFGGILGIIAINGLFLLKQDGTILDYSILFYSGMCFFMFWFRFYYSTRGMLTRVRQTVLNELDNPIVLFNDQDEFVIGNKLVEPVIERIKEENPGTPLTVRFFVQYFNFPFESIRSSSGTSHFQWKYEYENGFKIYRVDIKVLKDKKDRIIGKLVVFTDTSLEVDILTNFHSKNSFLSLIKTGKADFRFPVAVAICDINKLTSINTELGKEKGDEAVRLLSELMRHFLPKDSYFARLDDANLMAICPNTDIEQIRFYLSVVRKNLEKNSDFGYALEMQSAVAVATEDNPDIIEAQESAYFSLKFKKMMDGTSSHSSLLDSLAQTLQESDSTTRAHVERTRKMGDLLGQRLGFNDSQLSKLSLLCLTHDIGKLGIPLEILNKPGRLNSAEWEVMKSHVEKGYRIAKASKELEDIADLILHHHESWNGKGYPDGLKQEAIPLLSRVIAVVDTYDAMTNDRPYHKASKDVEARNELKRCAGMQFDPMIVSEFLNLLEEIKPLAEEEKSVENTTNFMPQGVNEVFSKPIESDNVQVIHYSRYYLNEEYKIVSFDENFAQLSGYSQEDLQNYNLTQWDLIPVEDREVYKMKVLNSGTTADGLYLEHRLLRKDGGIKDVICYGKSIFDSVSRQPRSEIIVFDASLTNIVLNVHKIEKESAQRSLDKWESLLRRDSLTGLLNHESFINDVECELLKENQKNVLMILDVDYFKNYNDSYGHLAGDKLLSLIAGILRNSVEDCGFAGRLGGDEFAALLTLQNSVSDDDVQKKVDKVFNQIINTTSSQSQSATISMGYAVNIDSKGFNKLYQAADAALYRAKENGRKCYSK